MKLKTKQFLSAVLIAAVTVTSVLAGSETVDAGTKRCTGEELYYESREYAVTNGKTASTTMCLGMTSTDTVSFETGWSIEPFEVYLFDKHKVTATSSKPSIVSVSVKQGGQTDIILKAKKKGTSTITVKTSCGNKYNLKVKVADHNYQKVEGSVNTMACKYCEAQTGGVDITEEEIHQRMLDAVGPDMQINGKKIKGYKKSWVCEDWQNWITKKVWGFEYCNNSNWFRRKRARAGDKEGFRRSLERSEYKNVRSGDVVFMPNHVCMVVKNLHDGRFTVTAWYDKTFYLGRSEEEALEKDLTFHSRYVISYDDKRIKSIHTYYKD